MTQYEDDEAREIRELVEKSSLGTAGARQLRARGAANRRRVQRDAESAAAECELQPLRELRPQSAPAGRDAAETSAHVTDVGTSTSSPISAGWRIGVPPQRARWFQDTTSLAALRNSLAHTGTVTLTGAGGVGKSQLAAEYARTVEAKSHLDLQMWIRATSRTEIVSSYAQAAWVILGSDPSGDPELAAQSFLEWLPNSTAGHNRPATWLIVFDDLGSPEDLDGLWPPATDRGRSVVTTRDRAAAAQNRDRNTAIEVCPFSRGEAVAYLEEALKASGRPRQSTAQLLGLTDDLERLPLALAHAATYISYSSVGCDDYRQQLGDWIRRLSALPTTWQTNTEDAVRVAAACVLSFELEGGRDYRAPLWLAEPVRRLATTLDSHQLDPPAAAAALEDLSRGLARSV